MYNEEFDLYYEKKKNEWLLFAISSRNLSIGYSKPHSIHEAVAKLPCASTSKLSESSAILSNPSIFCE